MVLLFVGVLYRSQIVDYVATSFYTPTTEVANIASELQLTPRGKDIFYASKPVIADSASSFPCKSGEVSSVILGCYAGEAGLFSTGTIYVLNVKNVDLEGVIQVTAAHELLHAAYSRLNIFERTRVDKLVLAEYEEIKGEPAIKEQMEYYKLAEPGQDSNELHSIIGTTVAKLDPELEAYYAGYFSNRSAIVAHYETYFAALHKNDTEIKALAAKLQAEMAALGQDTQTYQTDLQQLNLDIQSFNTRATSGGFTSKSSFEIARAALVTRVNAMDARADQLNARVAAYNEDVKRINSLSAQIEELYSSLKGVEAPSGV